MTSTPHLPITLDRAKPLEGIRVIMSTIRPDWTQIETRPFTEGLTNALYGVYDSKDPDDILLVRIYGVGTERFIDRRRELKTLQVLSQYGCTKPVHASFSNGLCYGYVPGNMMNVEMMRGMEYGALIAKEMARLHTIPIPENYAPELENQASFLHGTREMIKLLPQRLENEKDNERYQKAYQISKLLEGVTILESITKDFNEDFVLCHHDIFNRNLIYDDKKVHIIDYEYTGPGYASIDIGCHFMCYIGVDEPDLEAYPKKEHQLKFLRVYLEERNRYLKDAVEVNDELLELWYRRVNKMALVSYLYWGVWMIIQIGSDADFDFFDFGCSMIERFFEVKDEMLAL